MTAKTAEKQTTVPYASWKSFKTFLEGLSERGIPNRIDPTVMSSMSGATQSTIRVALTFLGLTDSDRAPTQTLKRLVDKYGQGEEWKEELRTVLMTAYQPVIAGLSLETGTAEELWRCFREHGNVRGSTLARAVRFFLPALAEAEVEYSGYFAPPRRPPKAKQEKETVSAPVGTRTPTDLGPDPAGNETQAIGHEGDSDGRASTEWPVHSFAIPTRDRPIQLMAPRDLTAVEWKLISAYIVGIIELAENRPPSPSANAEDEG